jgi:hypothetical protein
MTMSERRYWVIGGEFATAAFDELNTATARVFGPYESREEAEAAWRTVSRRHGHEFHTRFAVVQEPLRAAAG